MTREDSETLGAIVGIVMLYLAALWLVTSCAAERLRDPHEDGFIGAPVRKVPSEPVMISPADGCWYGGEKRELGVHAEVPRS
jgi:hypothetical protein